MASIKQSVRTYESWMRKELGRELVEKDLARKHEKMGESPFVFLRGTFWRWAETILEVCPDLAQAPRELKQWLEEQSVSGGEDLIIRRVVSADETIGPVVSPEFSFKAPHTVVLGVGKSGAEGIDFEHPAKTDVDASLLFSGKK